MIAPGTPAPDNEALRGTYRYSLVHHPDPSYRSQMLVRPDGKYVLATALIAAREALAAANADAERLAAFIRDFAEAKFDALPMPHIRHPADEPDPATDAAAVWAWQDDARAALTAHRKRMEAGNA